MNVVILSFLQVSFSLGHPFAGGSGTQEDPYQIATPQQLTSISSDPGLRSKHFVLTADLDLDPSEPSGQVFSRSVIAFPDSRVFSGTFDGAGHVIRNLAICSTDENCGLFERLGTYGIVCNLKLEAVNVIGYARVAGLVGTNYGTISNCHVTGTVNGYKRNAGGLVGENWGTVERCSFSGMVSFFGTAEEDFLLESHSFGGLIGTSRGLVVGCLTAVNVEGVTRAGGLVGNNSGVIKDCYSSGLVGGWDEVGGLIGFQSGTVWTSYSSCSVAVGNWADTRAGGLVGYNASLSGSSPADRTEEPSRPFQAATSSYFLSEVDGGGPDNGIGTALTYAQMQQKENFTGFDFWDDKDDGPRDHWFMPTGSPPVLVWQTDMTGLVAVPQVKGMTIDQARGLLETAGFSVSIDPQGDYDRAIPPGYVLGTSPAQFAKPAGKIALILSKGPYDWSTNPGDGTSQRPYQISTPGQLESLLDHPELYDRHFIQTADIDMAGRQYSTALIAPDTNDLAPGFQGTPFAGSFDGNGFKIIGLAIRTRARTHLGAFGFIGKDGIIIRLCLINALIIGDYLSDYMGTVAGCNSGTIESCVSVLGWVVGGPGGRSAYVGPLIGQNLGTTKDCQQLGVQLIPCYE